MRRFILKFKWCIIFFLYQCQSFQFLFPADQTELLLEEKACCTSYRIPKKNKKAIVFPNYADVFIKNKRNRQSPSYLLGLVETNKLYHQKHYKRALAKITQLLLYYPSSLRLLKMKGSLYIRLQKVALGIQTWEEALAFAPNDKKLKKALYSIKKYL